MADRRAIVPHISTLPSSNSSRAPTVTPGGSAAARLPPPSLLCNLCQKPLATTCFLCACDCIFCEECTYSHFEQSSQCPVCNKTLAETDFTELVVADATSATNDIAKTSLQALFSKQSRPGGSSNANQNLPLSDLCFSLVRQIDVVKQSTKFLLKQLLMSGSSTSRKVHHVIRVNEKLKHDITNLKQGQSSQRLQYEQVNTDLNNRLKAREGRIAEMNEKLKEKDRMLDQFRRLHGGNGNGNGNANANSNGIGNGSMSGSGHGHGHGHGHASGNMSMSQTSQSRHGHTISNSGGGSTMGGGVLARRHSNTASISNSIGNGGNGIGGNAPPLQGLMMQRQKQQAAQQQVFNRRRGPNMMSSSGASVQSSITGLSGMGSRRGHSHGNGMMGGDGSMNINNMNDMSMGPMVTRPFSSGRSTGSNSLNSVTPRVRDLSHNTAFNFSGGGGTNSMGGRSGGSGGGSGSHRFNKRRRTTDSTPMSNRGMSPNTAFTLNQGNHSVNRGGRWAQRDSGSFSR